MSENNQALALTEKTVEPVLENETNGNHALVPTKNLPVSKQISNEATHCRRKIFNQKGSRDRKSYAGFRGYLRLFHVSRVIGMLSLYLYLDQYELHRKQHLKVKEHREEQARQLTWLAVLGEKFYGVRLWFFHHIYSFSELVFRRR